MTAPFSSDPSQPGLPSLLIPESPRKRAASESFEQSPHKRPAPVLDPVSTPVNTNTPTVPNSDRTIPLPSPASINDASPALLPVSPPRRTESQEMAWTPSGPLAALSMTSPPPTSANTQLHRVNPRPRKGLLDALNTLADPPAATSETGVDGMDTTVDARGLGSEDCGAPQATMSPSLASIPFFEEPQMGDVSYPMEHSVFRDRAPLDPAFSHLLAIASVHAHALPQTPLDCQWLLESNRVCDGEEINIFEALGPGPWVSETAGLQDHGTGRLPTTAGAAVNSYEPATGPPVTVGVVRRETKGRTVFRAPGFKDQLVEVWFEKKEYGEPSPRAQAKKIYWHDSPPDPSQLYLYSFQNHRRHIFACPYKLGYLCAPYQDGADKNTDAQKIAHTLISESRSQYAADFNATCISYDEMGYRLAYALSRAAITQGTPYPNSEALRGRNVQGLPPAVLLERTHSVAWTGPPQNESFVDNYYYYQG